MHGLLNSNVRGTNIVPDIREYLTADGFSPFQHWFRRLDSTPRARVAVALQRLAEGNPGDHRGVGMGVLEIRLHAGPGYRVYFGRDGESLVILLAGGIKRRQREDIQMAHERWQDYHRRKLQER
jgi:putative addiction module killer protein